LKHIDSTFVAYDAVYLNGTFAVNGKIMKKRPNDENNYHFAQEKLAFSVSMILLRGK
jgi:hypothetical protein